ncbi:TPA: hypothetical protein ACOC7H_002383 [Klebsiella pneumoniae]
MMKKSLCCALLLTASFSTFAAAKTEQQIAESPLAYGELQSRKADAIVEINYLNSRYSRD